MRILSCGGLFLLCVYNMSPETCSLGVYRPNRTTGLWRANWDAKIDKTAPANNEFGEEFIRWKFLNSTDHLQHSREKILRRKPRCYDNSKRETDPEPAATVKYLAIKLPSWAGTLYHHRILHPYHDWSDTGIPDDLWNR